MSTATLPKIVTQFSDLDPEGYYTYADYMLWQFQERVELIKGKIFKMSPAPNTLHQKISISLASIIFVHFKPHHCQAFAAPFDVRLPVKDKKGRQSTVVQPDLCVICDESKLDEQGCNGAPDWVIEILSPGNSKFEMLEKFRIYEEAGVREYWMVHPVEKYLLPYILNEAGQYSGLAPAGEEDQLIPHIFPDLVIDLKEVFS